MARAVVRYIAIIHPLKAHIVCSRRRMVLAIGSIWLASLALALPTAIYNTTGSPSPALRAVLPPRLCGLRLPSRRLHVAYKYAEAAAFYALPVVTQVACYAVVGRALLASAGARLRRCVSEHGGRPSVGRQRQGVVKMLVASVAVYVVSYSPHQALLLYNTLAPAPLRTTWALHVAITAMAYVNSAANPLLYCVFSHKFRAKFAAIFCFWRRCRRRRQPDTATTSGTRLHVVMTPRGGAYGHSSSESTAVTRYTQLAMRTKGGDSTDI